MIPCKSKISFRNLLWSGLILKAILFVAMQKRQSGLDFPIFFGATRYLDETIHRDLKRDLEQNGSMKGPLLPPAFKSARWKWRRSSDSLSKQKHGWKNGESYRIQKHAKYQQFPPPNVALTSLFRGKDFVCSSRDTCNWHFEKIRSKTAVIFLLLYISCMW